MNTTEFFAALFSALQLYSPEQVDPSQRTPNTPQSQVAEKYDFIIVGGGTAGCVLANRLTENPNWTVLLIEAGVNDNYVSDTPFLAETLLNTERDWNYTTVPQERACLSDTPELHFYCPHENMTTAEFFSALFSALQLYSPEQVDPSQRTPNTPQSHVAEKYDFIIVGGGTAGCVLANRLTENSNWTVLLIEAGGNDDYISDIPFLAETLPNTERDWNYTTVPQERACLSTGGICSVNRGRVIGGSSTINFMLYVRGNRADYDEWEHLGNEGWGYEDMLPYFIKSENMTEPSLACSRYHGTRGPLNVQYPRFITPIRQEYINAGQEIGWQFGDYNGEDQSVIRYNQCTLDGALRESTTRAYLTPIRNRENLHVILESRVSKVIIENKEAKGVEYFRDNASYRVLASKDVILSAGTIDSAKLLLLSGIGPRSELSKLNIDVVMDLPVGSNYVDHEYVTVHYQLSEHSPTVTPSLWMTNESIMAYARNGSGPLTMCSLALEANACINPQNQSEPPSTMIAFSSYGNLNEVDNRHIIRFTIFNLKPYSTGYLKLRSNNFRDPPLIQPNMLQNKADLNILAQGIETVFKFMETEAMSQYSPKLYTENLQPACSGLTGRVFVDCVIVQYSFPGLHCIGTAKMGPREGRDTVVSSDDLLVKGLKRLRVVDGAIIPTIPRANTYAVIIAVAERGADIIKSSYNSATRHIIYNFFGNYNPL